MKFGEIIGIGIVFLVGLTVWSGMGLNFIHSMLLSWLVIFVMLFFFRKTEFGSFVYNDYSKKEEV